MYCGAGKLPRGKQYGSEADCVRQFRLYGQYAIANPHITKFQSSGKIPVYCGAKQSKRRHGTAAECKAKRQLRRYGVFAVAKKTNKASLRPNSAGPKSVGISRRSDKSKAAKKIQAIMKMKKEKQKFNGLMKNVNAAQYRRKRQKMLKTLLQHPEQFTSHTLLHPIDFVQQIRILSTGGTGSDASVVLLNTKGGYMVCKFTESMAANAIDDPGKHEMKLYNLLNNLVDHNVTPFIIKSLMTSEFQDDIHPDITNKLALYGKQHVLLTESVEHTDVTTLSRHLSNKPDHHIVFQVLWTLECFNRIGLRHNDLHKDNIMVMKHKRPKNSYRIFKYTCLKTMTKKILYVPALDYEVRIFDFDRSGKCAMERSGSRKLKSVYRKRQALLYKRDKFMRDLTQSHANNQYDTYKIMQHMPMALSYKIPGFKYETKLSPEQKQAELKKNVFSKDMFIGFQLCIKKYGSKDAMIDGYPDTMSILEYLVARLGYTKKPPKSHELIEIYDMDNLLIE